jgi:hypothetical protein
MLALAKQELKTKKKCYLKRQESERSTYKSSSDCLGWSEEEASIYFKIGNVCKTSRAQYSTVGWAQQ